MSLSYAVHIPVINLSCSAECCLPIKSCLQLNCCSISEYCYPVSFEHNKVYLFPATLLQPFVLCRVAAAQQPVWCLPALYRPARALGPLARGQRVPGVRWSDPPAASEACDQVPGVLLTSWHHSTCPLHVQHVLIVPRQ